MATAYIVPTEDFTKQSDLHVNCSCQGQTHSQISPSLPSSSNSKHEADVTSKIQQSFDESPSMKQVRIRSLSHWRHVLPSHEAMAAAGWFSCNVNDRVICIYCNTICHQWTIHDDPLEVHARLAPQCPFVLSTLLTASPPKIINETLTDDFKPAHPVMASISRRQESFSNITWPTESPAVDDLVRAGFFFSGVSSVVTCFNCNGSLHKWGPDDNPTMEHARWFPNCVYAKHLCGDKLYRKIQATKKRALPAASTLSAAELNQMVSARLDLPVVKRLQPQYRLEVIKRCIEDQFKIKNDDFASDSDLAMACLILKKQIDHIKGCKDNIITPSATAKPQSSSQPSKTSLGECLVCLTEEKQLACMPCGHLCACVPCGYALRTCPVCRQNIQCFMRIN